MTVRIVTKNPADGHCSHCVRAKNLLELKGYEYVEEIMGIDITREQLLEQAPTARTFPQIWIGEEYIGGADQLEAWFKAKEE